MTPPDTEAMGKCPDATQYAHTEDPVHWPEYMVSVEYADWWKAKALRLAEYGSHDLGCGMHGIPSIERCSCGLTDLLAAIKEVK